MSLFDSFLLDVKFETKNIQKDIGRDLGLIEKLV